MIHKTSFLLLVFNTYDNYQDKNQSIPKLIYIYIQLGIKS